MVKMVLFPPPFPDCGYPPYLADEPVANSARKIQSHPPPAQNASDSQKPVFFLHHIYNDDQLAEVPAEPQAGGRERGFRTAPGNGIPIPVSCLLSQHVALNLMDRY